jgi:hypothetical protein
MAMERVTAGTGRTRGPVAGAWAASESDKHFSWQSIDGAKHTAGPRCGRPVFSGQGLA